MALDLQALATEINTDPNSYGYAAMVAAGSDQGVADLLNEVRAGISIKRADVGSREIYEAILVADYPELPNNPNSGALSLERRYLAWLPGIMALNRVRLQNEDDSLTTIAQNLQAMFPAGSGTRNRIVALMTRLGSRAEQLWGPGTYITAEQVGFALRGGAPT